MNVIFRVEAGAYIGMGHASRCAVLAGCLSARGARVYFIGTKIACDNIRRISSVPEGCSYYILPDGLNELEDAEAVAAIISAQLSKVDWVVVDHYGLGEHWERQVKFCTQRLMAIDDLGRSHVCDVLLDQNWSDNPAQKYANKIPSSCQTLLGPSYALLRKSVVEARASIGTLRHTAPCRILVCFGGSDMHNTTSIALEAMSLLPELAIVANIVIGSLHPQRSMLEQYCSRFPEWNLIVDHAAPEELMADADIGIGAGGVMTWERFAMGLPSIVVSIADNQKATSAALGVRNSLLYAGHYDQVSSEYLRHCILSLWNDVVTRKRMRTEGMVMVDGQGAERVAQIMYS